MRAIVQDTYGPVDNLRLAEIETPVPAVDAVLIRVRAAGVDPGVWHLMTGRPYMMRLMGMGFTKPKVAVAGWDAAGVVEAVGSAVTRFSPGDEVFGNTAGGTGTFAEYACLPESNCAPKPHNLSFEEASALPVSGCTALQAVRDVAEVAPGMKVLVLGAAGGVGHHALQIARAHGAAVTGVCSTLKVDAVRALGVTDVIDYTQQDLRSLGRKWDAIIDTGGRRSLSELRTLLSPKGVLAIVGGEGGNAWTGGFLERILGGAFRSIGSAQKLKAVTATTPQADLLVLKDLVEAGQLRPSVHHRYALTETAQAIKDLVRGQVIGKSVVVMD